MIHSVTLAIAAGVALAGAAEACAFMIPPPEEIARAQSRGVIARNDCSFENGGIHDDIAFGPAQDLGRGRIYQQLVGGRLSMMFPYEEVFVADCDAALVTMLSAPADTNSAHTDCGYLDDIPLTGPVGLLTLTEGETLYELEEFAKERGVHVLSFNEELLQTNRGNPVPARDFVDAMCGCRIFYPGSPGALH